MSAVPRARKPFSPCGVTRVGAQEDGPAQGGFEIGCGAATGEGMMARPAPGLAILDARSLRPLKFGGPGGSGLFSLPEKNLVRA